MERIKLVKANLKMIENMQKSGIQFMHTGNEVRQFN